MLWRVRGKAVSNWIDYIFIASERDGGAEGSSVSWPTVLCEGVAHAIAFIKILHKRKTHHHSAQKLPSKRPKVTLPVEGWAEYAGLQLPLGLQEGLYTGSLFDRQHTLPISPSPGPPLSSQRLREVNGSPRAKRMGTKISF